MTKSKVGAEPKKNKELDMLLLKVKTTVECMENHLIHLPSGRTIEAVGTLDI